MAIIGISGKKHHGKDLLAMIIQFLVAKSFREEMSDTDLESFIGSINQSTREYMSGWQKQMFAQKVKEIVCLLIGCTMEQLEDQDFKEKPLGPEWDRYVNTFLETEASWTKIRDEDEYNSLSNVGKRSYERRSMTPRLMLQLMGTECGRKIIHPNIWVNALMSEYKPYNEVRRVDISKAKREGGNYIVPTWPSIPERYWGMKVSVPLIEWTNHDEDLFPNWIITDIRFPNEVEAIKAKGGIVIRVNRPGMDDSSTHDSEVLLDNYDGFDAVFDNNGSIDLLIDQADIYLRHIKIIPNG